MNDSSTPKRRVRNLAQNLPFLMVMLVGVFGFIGLSSLRRPPDTIEISASAPLVATAEVHTSDRNLTLEADGEVVPFREVTLSAQVAGRIVTKEEVCRAGNFVHQGDLLMTIDPRDYDLEIQRIEQLVKQTDVNIEEMDVERQNTEKLLALAKSDVEYQQRELERIKSLIQQRATSQASLDTAERARIQAENSVQQLQNQIRLTTTRRGRFVSEKERLQVDLEQAILNRNRCDIVAPMDGVIVSDLVERDDTVQLGTQLCQLEDTLRVEVKFDLKLEQLQWIWENNDITMTEAQVARTSYELPPLEVDVVFDVDGYRYMWKGRLDRYDGAGLNPATRTVPCIAVVDKPRNGCWDAGQQVPPSLPGPPALLRGMFVAVHIDVPSRQPVLEVPLVALRPGNRVWVVRGEKLNVVDVRVAQATENSVLVFAGETSLKANDQVIISPLALAINQMPLRVDTQTMNVSEVSSLPDAVDGAASETGENATTEELSR